MIGSQSLRRNDFHSHLCLTKRIHPCQIENLLTNDVALGLGGRGILVADMGKPSRMMFPDGKLWPIDRQEAFYIAKNRP